LDDQIFNDDKTTISEALGKALRHGVTKGGRGHKVPFDSGGCCPFDHLSEFAQEDRLRSCSIFLQDVEFYHPRATLKERVKLEETWRARAILQGTIPSKSINSKARFQAGFCNCRQGRNDFEHKDREESCLLYDVLCVRAAQGHSMPIVDADRVAVMVNAQIEKAPQGLFHVTPLENLESIMESGLLPGWRIGAGKTGRTHLRLSPFPIFDNRGTTLTGCCSKEVPHLVVVVSKAATKEDPASWSISSSTGTILRKDRQARCIHRPRARG
jgi:hypothetical protein